MIIINRNMTFVTHVILSLNIVIYSWQFGNCLRQLRAESAKHCHLEPKALNKSYTYFL
jgi:hypothetical protein